MRIRNLKIVVIICVVLVAGQAFAAGIVDEAAQAVPVKPDPEQDLVQHRYLRSFQARFETSPPGENISIFQYSSSDIVKIRLRENMLTNIVFPEGEQVISYALGDQVNFRFIQNPKGSTLSNVAMVYGIFPGADTNLTVFGRSGNIYSFYLRNYSVAAENVAPDFRIEIKDASVKDRVDKVLKIEEDKQKEADQRLKALNDTTKGNGEYLRSIPDKVDPSQINMAYAVSKDGADELRPLRIYDDGYWTYFVFDPDTFDKMSGVPVLYRVVDGFDTHVNTRYQNGKIIAETVNDRWTLWSGDKYLCVKRLRAGDHQ